MTPDSRPPCMGRVGCDPARYTHGADCPRYPWPQVLDTGRPA